ncbi:hypothetical protein C0Q70_01108 [Pomacea canaliculata]|uniref:Uncharacterized protein n=1 Tax=Pomacea canaliculata TaxID=400727 RepID=A0A2T7PYJ7_POMCA|nr:hypothetical protein C0Q70_01108 [Pomacea canaliculata]
MSDERPAAQVRCGRRHPGSKEPLGPGGGGRWYLRPTSFLEGTPRVCLGSEDEKECGNTLTLAGVVACRTPHTHLEDTTHTATGHLPLAYTEPSRSWQAVASRKPWLGRDDPTAPGWPGNYGAQTTGFTDDGRQGRRVHQARIPNKPDVET